MLEKGDVTGRGPARVWVPGTPRSSGRGGGHGLVLSVFICKPAFTLSYSENSVYGTSWVDLSGSSFEDEAQQWCAPESDTVAAPHWTPHMESLLTRVFPAFLWCQSESRNNLLFLKSLAGSHNVWLFFSLGIKQARNIFLTLATLHRTKEFWKNTNVNYISSLPFKLRYADPSYSYFLSFLHHHNCHIKQANFLRISWKVNW